MKTQLLMLRWMLVLAFATGALGVMGQPPYPNPGDDVVCLGFTKHYGVALTAGSSYQWVLTPVTGGNGIMNVGATPNLVTVLWTSPGTCTLKVTETNSFGCVGDPQTITVTVNPLPLAVATPPAQTLCSNVPIATIVLSTSNNLTGTTYAWTRDNNTNATGMAASGAGNISGTLINVTGSPQTVTFTIIPTSGNNCVGASITATVTVNPMPIAIANPALQTKCSDVAINPILLSTSNGVSATTYAWSRDNNTNVTGIAASGTGNISGTMTNLTGTSQTVIFTIIPTSAENCAGTPITSTVIVEPEPVALATPAAQTKCSDVAIITITLTTSNNMPTSTFAWTRDNLTNVTGMAPSGAGDIAGTLTNLTGVVQIVTFTIIPSSAGGCVGNPITATVTVDPEPVAVAMPAAQAKCSNVAITTIALSTNNGMSATTYAWTRDNMTNVTGIDASGIGNIAGTLTNLTGTPQIVTFTIIPTSAIGCVGNTITATVTVDPEPLAVALPVSQTLCSDIAIATIMLSTSNGLTGTTYAWTRNNTTSVTGMPENGTGNISGTLTNVTGLQQTVTFTIIPTSLGGCVGNTITATVIVNPEPVAVATPATQTRCSHIPVDPILLSTSNSLTGTTYTWTRDNTTNVTGIANNGAGNISGTLTNLTGLPQTVTFTIIPTSAISCVGNTITATVIVNPEPVAIATPSTQTLCSDIPITTISLGTSNSLSGTTFTWTRDNLTNVTGIADNGTGNISGTLTNLTSSSQTVTFTIIPTSGIGCVGATITATVIIDPEPVAVAAPATQTLCSDIPIATIVLSASNLLSGTTFAWTRDNNINVTGMAGSGAGNISGTLTNVTGIQQTVTFTIIPSSQGGCVGNTITATVIVNPEPVATATPPAQSLCSDVAITTIVLGTSNSLTGTTYAWTRNNTTNVTGIPDNGTGDISGTLTNLTSTSQTVTFTITPTSAIGCIGNTITATITVSPEPLAVATPPSQTLCSDVPITTIILSTSNSLTGTVYAWTRDNLTNATGIAASGTGDISGTLNNVTGVPQTVTFTIIPTSAGGCVGSAITATTIINPEPVAVATPSTQTLCSAVPITTIALSTSNSLTGATFAWTRDNTTNVTGIAGNGTGNISGTLTNHTGISQTVTFTIIPTSALNCVGNTITATVIVDPEPVAVATPPVQTLCSDIPINTIILSTSNSLTGTIFTWTRDNITNVTGISNSGTGNIAGTLTNLTGSTQIVTFTITPASATGCVGDQITATVAIKPEPVAVATPALQTKCSDVAITSIVLTTSNSMPTATFAWTRDNILNVTGIAASGTGNITGTLTNLTGSPQTVTFTIIPTSAEGCIGDPITAVVIVEPEPIAVATPAAQTVCSEVTITSIMLSTSNNMPTTTYAWSRDNNTNVTGIPSSGSGNVSGILTNITDIPQTVTFTITPTSAGGCIGNPITATVIVNPKPVTSVIFHD